MIEDDAFSRVALVDALKLQRLNVVAGVSTAKEALDAQKKFEPNVAVCDLDLGVGPTGLDIAEVLRQRNPNIGIVMLMLGIQKIQVMFTFATPRRDLAKQTRTSKHVYRSYANHCCSNQSYKEAKSGLVKKSQVPVIIRYSDRDFDFCCRRNSHFQDCRGKRGK